MDIYSLMREFADSWALLALFLFFVSVCAWAFLPSQRGAREDAANIPFRNDTAPAVDSGEVTAQMKGTDHV